MKLHILFCICMLYVNNKALLAFTRRTHSLITDIPVLLKHLPDIYNRYDVFLFDQYGVLHDGMNIFDGVKETLAFLKQNNKTISLVSNTSRRSKEAIEGLEKLRFDPSIFDLTFTSGELCYDFLRDNLQQQSNPSNLEFKLRGATCCYISFGTQSPHMLSELGIECVGINEADFILLSGTHLLHLNSKENIALNICNTGNIDDIIMHTLLIAKQSNIPIICANSDLIAINMNKKQFMPGMIAREYEQMGGFVKHFGKPHSAIFEAAITASLEFHNKAHAGNKCNNSTESIAVTLASKLLKINTNINERLRQTLLRRERMRVLHVGDSMHHDILGAFNANIDSLLVTRHCVHRDIFEENSNSQTSTSTAADGCKSPPPYFIPTEMVSLEQEEDIVNMKKYYKFDQSQLGEASLIFKVCNYCDEENLPRPTYIIRQIMI